MTMDLFSEFQETSATQWLEQIKRDLKGKDPEALKWSPDGYLSLSPFVHADHIPNAIAAIPSFGTWAIGESFVLTDPQETNRQILAALNGGVEAIDISCAHDTAWGVLLNGVSLPLIHLGLQISGDVHTAIDLFKKYAEQVCVFGDLRVSVNAIPDGYLNVRGVYPAIDAEHIANGLTSTLLQMLELSNWHPEQLARCDIRLTTGAHYLIEIARLRACRILWYNLAEALDFTVSTSFAIEAHTAEEAGDDDPYTHMIRSAFMGTAAVLGGADRVYISPASGVQQSESFYRHVARNIPHLLRYESKFTEIPDPIAGSYYLDHAIKVIVEESWARLIGRLKK